jgi:dienelactone hydrolase
MIWDGIRSIDYLLSRKEVDPQRIGITGRSGGGTQSVYISAYDDRILAAAPENYVTGFRYLLTSIGPQDAEQNLPHFLKNNLDFADFLEVRMPKPTLIVSTLNDFFSIQGVRETFKEVQKAYGAFNAEEKFQKTEDVAEHASTLKNREATYAFFQKYLDNPGDPKDENVAIFDKEDLMVTSTGQVLTAYQAETIFSLNKKESLKIIEDRIKQKGELIADQNYLNESIRALTGYTDLKEDNHYTFSGSVKYDQLTVYKYLIDGNQARKIPLVVIIPESSDKEKAVIILSPEGKAVELVSGLPEYLASQGYYVILPDLSGSGELSDPSQRGDSYISHSSYNMWYAGILTGKSLISLRLEDIASVCKFAMQEFELKEGNLYGIARDVFTSDLLHANILSGCFSRLALINPLISLKSLVLNHDYHPKYIQSSIDGSIAYYDLPDLIAGLSPSRILMINLKDQSGKTIDNYAADPDIQKIFEEYKRKQAEPNFRIKSWGNEPYEVLLKEWLE